MASPVTSALPAGGGNLYAAASLAASASVGAYLDCSTFFATQVTARDTTGGTAAATSGVSFVAYKVYSAILLTTGTTSANATSLTAGGTSVTITAGQGPNIHKGQKIMVDGGSGGGPGEIVTVSAISTDTLTISALQYNHANGVNVYIIAMISVNSTVLGQNLTAANTTYSQTFYMGTDRYVFYLTNLDATNAVNVEMNNDQVTSVA